MINSTELLLNAEFALAAYANLDDGTLDRDAQRAALVNAGMTETQAANFASHYSVVTQFDDITETGNSSFNATVFKDAGGNLTLAFRGTLEAPDFFPTDLDIWLRGAGYDQIIAMYNWWLRVSTPADELVNQYKFGIHSSSDPEPPNAVVELYTQGNNTLYLETISQVEATGELVDDLAADPDQKLDVAGHSLGAHLALAFNTLFSNDTNQVTGFNTPGFINNTTNQQFFAALGGQVPVAGNSGNVINVIANQANIGEEPFSRIAKLHFENNPTGAIIDIAIEDQFLSDELNPADAKNHSQQILTDSLAVYNLLTQLDPSLSVSAYKAILNASAIGTAASYERIVDALEILVGLNSTPLPTGNLNREELYQAIYAVREAIFVDHNAAVLELKPEFQGLTLTPLNALASEIKVKALGVSLDDPADAIAYRYALAHLNPFVITGNNALYDLHNPVNANGVGPLDLENFSEDYLQDAADFLALKIELGLADKESKSGGSIFTQVYQKLEDTGAGEKEIELRINNIGPGGSRDRYFIFGGAGNDKLEGDSRADHLYGNDGDDELSGKGGRDILEGNFGNDVLYGGYKVDGVSIDDGVSDILRGGAGFDTYHVGHGDVIQDDAAGEGAIFLPNGTEVSDRTYTLSAGTDNVYVNGDLRLIHVENVITYVTDTVSGLTFNLLGFQPGHFGITLDGAVQTNFTLIEGTDNTDEITGTADADEIRGYLGNDRLFGQAGNDLIDGGEGDNYLDGGDGDDTLTVGSGRNFLGGAGGHDVLTGGAGGNFLQGGFGHDTLQGGAGDDLLVGDAGADVLRGGAGNDLLIGDGGYFTLDTWGFTFIDTTPGEPGGIVVTFAEGVFGGMDSVDDQGDILYGEEGDDVLFGGGGNDQLFGGEDHDSLIGGDGDDYLDGGDGDDYLDGDDINDPAATGHDTLFGGAGNDILDDGAGDDYLSGGDGNDTLYGDDGDDVIFGQAGDDFADGGAGNDKYITWMKLAA
jgi:Ca2+-binding RTX toxin-like protein